MSVAGIAAAIAAALGAGFDDAGPEKAAAPPAERCATIEVYKDVRGGWRWIRRSDAPTCQSHGPFASARAAAADAGRGKSLCDRIVTIDEPTD